MIFTYKLKTIQHHEGHFQAIEYTESNLLSVTILKPASVVEKRKFRRIEMKGSVVQKISSHPEFYIINISILMNIVVPYFVLLKVCCVISLNV